MKKITKLATRLRVALTLCALTLGFSPSFASPETDYDWLLSVETIVLGDEEIMSQRLVEANFQMPENNYDYPHKALTLNTTCAGTLYVSQAYKKSQTSSVYSLLFKENAFDMFDSDVSPYIISGETLDNNYTYQSLKYDISADETIYLCWEIGSSKTSSGKVSINTCNATEVQFLWIPENYDVEIPENSEFNVNSGQYYIFTTPENTKFLTLTSDVNLPVISVSSINYSGFLFDNFGQMCGFGEGRGKNIAAISEEEDSFTYFCSNVASNYTFFIKSEVDATIKIETANEIILSVNEVSPSPGEAIQNSDWTGEISMNFYPRAGFGISPNNQASLTYYPSGSDEPSTILLTPTRNGDTWVTDIYEYYLHAQPGTEISLSVSGLQYLGFNVSENATGNDNVSINEEGTVTVTYPKPVFAAEPYNWQMLYAYYAPGTAAGIVTLTFNEAITNADPYASLVFGDPDATDAPTVNIPLTYKNNTLTLDFTGIDFERVTGVDLSSFEYSTATVTISGLASVSGQEFDGDGILSQSLNFSDTYYGNVAPQRYITQEAVIISPAVGTYLPALYEFVIAWGEDNPVSIADGSVLLTLQINDESPVYVAGEVDAEGYLVVDVSQWSIVDGENVYGSYTLTLPEGYVVNDQNLMNKAQAVIYDFTDGTTGVSSLEIDLDAQGAIYNLQGIKMNVKNAAELPKGIYIINGKKIIK